MLSAVGLLSACGGGGGGGAPAPAPAPTFAISGSVSGLSAGTLVLQVTGRADVTATTNGNLPLASGLANGTAYAVSVKTQPSGLICTVANGSGSIAGANVTNVQIGCTEIAVNIAEPADRALVPINVAQNISASLTGISADRLTWVVLPEGMAANATLVPVSSSGTTSDMAFTATVPADYTVRVTSLDDASKTAEVELRVHQVYIAVSGKSQDRIYLQADGRIRSDLAGAPVDAANAVANGNRFGVAAMADGSVVAWGTNISAPVPPGLGTVTALAANDFFAMAQKADGTLEVWGESNTSAVLPTSLVDTKVIGFDSTNPDMAAILEDGTLIVWYAESGTLKTLPSGWQGKKFTKVCGTTWHVVAVDEDGALYSWNSVNSSDPELETPPATTGPVTDVFCGSDHAALVQEDGRVATWGVNLGGNGAFDSSTVSGFPRIKGAAFYTYSDPHFLTEGGAVVDIDGEVVRDIDNF